MQLQKAQSELSSWLDDTLSHPGAYLTKMFGMQDRNVVVYKEKFQTVDKLLQVEAKLDDIERVRYCVCALACVCFCNVKENANEHVHVTKRSLINVQAKLHDKDSARV